MGVGGCVENSKAQATLGCVMFQSTHRSARRHRSRTVWRDERRFNVRVSRLEADHIIFSVRHPNTATISISFFPLQHCPLLACCSALLCFELFCLHSLNITMASNNDIPTRSATNATRSSTLSDDDAIPDENTSEVCLAAQ